MNTIEWFDIEFTAPQVQYLDCVKPTSTTAAINKAIQRNKKKGNTMYDEFGDYVGQRATLDEQRIDHLKNRAREVAYTKLIEAQKKFGMRDDDTPTTLEEFIKRVQDGKFTVSEDKKKKNLYWHDALRYIRWRDPELKEDQEGYEAVEKEISKQRDRLIDDIMVGDPKAGLEALRVFEEQNS